jgi:hypothetical protein
MKIERATVQDVRFVADNMRELDRRELTATGCDFATLPERVMAGSVFVFAAIDDFQMPHAIWGLQVGARQGIGHGFAFGTKHWGKALPAILKNIKDFVLPFLLQNGFHRVECLALAHRKDVERFLELIGAYPEATLSQWGAGGEDFTAYRWLADEYRVQKRLEDEYRAEKRQTFDRHVSH